MDHMRVLQTWGAEPAGRHAETCFFNCTGMLSIIVGKLIGWSDFLAWRSRRQVFPNWPGQLILVQFFPAVHFLPGLRSPAQPRPLSTKSISNESQVWSRGTGLWIATHPILWQCGLTSIRVGEASHPGPDFPSSSPNNAQSTMGVGEASKSL